MLVRYEHTPVSQLMEPAPNVQRLCLAAVAQGSSPTCGPLLRYVAPLSHPISYQSQAILSNKARKGQKKNPGPVVTTLPHCHLLLHSA